jgi:hypothetical protein
MDTAALRWRLEFDTFLGCEPRDLRESGRIGPACGLLLELVTVFGQVLLLSLIPLLPVGAAIDAEVPHPPTADAPTQDQTNGSFFSRSPTAPTPAPPLPDLVRQTAIYYVGGLGTPVGIAGFEAVRRLGRRFEVAGGFGFGLAAAGSEPKTSFGHVLQWSLMPRLRLGDDHAFTAGAGISGGNFGNMPLCIDGDPCSATNYPVSYFLWSNFEIGGEWWWSGGFALRVFGGYARGWCVSASDSCVDTVVSFPYFGWGLGYAF